MSSISNSPLERRASSQPAEPMRKRDALRSLLLPKEDLRREDAKKRLIPEGSKRARIVGLFRSSIEGSEGASTPPASIEPEDDLESFVMLSSNRPVPPPRDEMRVLEQKLKCLEQTITAIERAFNPETGPINPIPDSYSLSDRIDYLLKLVNSLKIKMEDSSTHQVAEINRERYEELIRAENSLVALKMSLTSASSSSEPEVDSPITLSEEENRESSPEIAKSMNPSDKGKEEDLSEESASEIMNHTSSPILDAEISEEEKLEAFPSPKSIEKIKELQIQIEKNKEELSGQEFLIDLEKERIKEQEKEEGIIAEKMRSLTRTRPQPNSPEFEGYKRNIESLRGPLKKTQNRLASHKKRLQDFETHKKQLKQIQQTLNSELIEAVKPNESMKAAPSVSAQPSVIVDPKEDKSNISHDIVAPSIEEKKQEPSSPKPARENSSEAPSLEQLKGEIKVIIGKIREVQGKKTIKEQEKATQAEEIKALQDDLMDLLVQKQKIKAKQHSTHAASSQNGSSSGGIESLSNKLHLLDQEIQELAPQSSDRIILESIASELRKQIMALSAQRTKQYQSVESASGIGDFISSFLW